MLSVLVHERYLTNLVAELESIRTSLTTSNTALQTDLDAIKARVAETTEALDDARRYNAAAWVSRQQYCVDG